MDFEFIRRFAPMYVQAAGLTLSIGLFGIALSLLIGLLCCLLRVFRVPLLRQLCALYIELARNTPLLVQLFFLYFGLPKAGVRLSAQACAVTGLSFLGGAYMAEALRSGLESVEKAQLESGACLGLTRAQVLAYIVFPQAIATAAPAICANVIFLIKETSVFSAVALADLMYVAKDLIGMYYKTDEALFMLVVAYLVILLPISLLFSLVERRLRHDTGSGRAAQRA